MRSLGSRLRIPKRGATRVRSYRDRQRRWQVRKAPCVLIASTYPSHLQPHKKPASQPEKTVNSRKHSEKHPAGQMRFSPDSAGQGFTVVQTLNPLVQGSIPWRPTPIIPVTSGLLAGFRSPPAAFMY
jgi:hypothetical protein